MRLLNLELENWSCHKSMNLDLSGGIQIEGRNGSGKTSILEAIRFMFAESALGYKNRIRNGERSARVRLSFVKDGSNYLLEKEIFVDKPSTARLMCNETVMGDNPTSAYRSMQNMLDENILDKLLYIPQGGLTSIVESLTRKEGRKELDSLFGLEKFDRVYRNSAEDVKEAKMRLDYAAEQLARHPEDAGKQYREEAEKAASEGKSLEDEVKALERGMAKAGEEIGKTGDEIKAMEAVKTEIDRLKEDVKKLEVEQAKTNAELENAGQKLEGMAKAAEEIRKLEVRESETKKYPKIREAAAKLDRLLDRQAGMKIGQDREKLKMLEAELAAKKDFEKKNRELQEAVRESEALNAGLEHDLRKEEATLREIESLDGKARCPRCKQMLTREHLEREKTATAEVIGKLRENLSQLQEKLARQAEEQKNARENLLRLEKTEAEWTYIKTELGKKAGESDAIKREIEELKKKLAEAGCRDEPPESVEQKVDEYNRIKGELERLKHEIKQKGELEEKQRKLSEKAADVSLRREEKNKRLSLLEYDDEGLRRLRERKDSLTERRHGMEKEADRKRFRISEINSKAEESKKKLGEYEKLKSEREARDKEMRLLSQAREVFHTDKGIQKYLRDRYINQLNNLLTYYFKRINENPRYREIVFDKNYEIQVKTSEGDMTVDQLSGGEKIQLAITLRIALTEILSHTRLLILDEPFGSLDKNHREILGETLTKIASNGQLILVTHVHVDSLQLERVELDGY